MEQFTTMYTRDAAISAVSVLNFLADILDSTQKSLSAFGNIVFNTRHNAFILYTKSQTFNNIRWNKRNHKTCCSCLAKEKLSMLEHDQWSFCPNIRAFWTSKHDASSFFSSIKVLHLKLSMTCIRMHCLSGLTLLLLFFR